MPVYFRLIIFNLLCIISSSVCDICSTCSCSAEVNEGSVINCHGQNLEENNILSSDLLMLNEGQTINKLILSGNDISNLPRHLLKRLAALRKLDLSDNLMKDVYADTFSDLSSLENLNLSKNVITKFDDALLAALPALLTLDLSHNNISDIEHAIGKAKTNLTHLNLSYNAISNLSNSSFESLPNLQYLNLSFNRIHALKNDTFMHLSSLKILCLSNNFLTSLDMQVLPQSLIELNSGYNSITEIFPVPFKIEVLNLEYNKLSKIHQNLTMLEYLQHLNIRGNMLSEFPDLLLERLEVLDISHNNFSYIPESVSIKNFPLLTSLDVSENPIPNLTFHSELKLHSFVASNISVLKSIEQNTLKKLQAPAESCINLTISNNKMLSFVHEGALRHMLQNLCSLDLSNNKITYIPQNLIAHNASSIINSINLQGNPFKCDCSLQWMLNDLVPKLYYFEPRFLNNLRCDWPPEISKTRMVHWFGWKGQIFCMDKSDFYEQAAVNIAGVASVKSVTLDSSPAVIAIMATAISVLTILIIIGFVWTRRLIMRKRRINRKF